MSDQFDYFDSADNTDTAVQVQQPEQPTYTRQSYQANVQNQNQEDEYQQPVVQQYDDVYNAYEPEEVTAQMLEMRRKEQEIKVRLQKKALDERQLKEQRKQEGKQQLQRFKTNRIKQIQRLKAENRAMEKKTTVNKEYNNPWAKIVDNIAIKQGQRAGTKNITRMKQALVRRSKD